jgi:hypothetical protein
VASEHDEEIASLKRAVLQENNYFGLLHCFNFVCQGLCSINNFFCFLFVRDIRSISPYFPPITCHILFDLENFSFSAQNKFAGIYQLGKVNKFRYP